MDIRMTSAVAAAFVLVGMCVGGTATGSDAAVETDARMAGCDRPLDILLTNDDGYTAPGINAVYAALTAAGEHVTMVAPATNQTGKGGALAYGGTLTVTQPVDGDPQVYAVAGTPADAVALALGALYPDRQPDLVVSGTNAGTNLSRTINHSGTVGAAVTAMDLGVPAIAVSSAHPAEFDPNWDGTGSEDYEGTARLVRRMVRTIQRTALDCRHLMPGTSGLNVNYPARPLRGVRVATLGIREPIPTTYTKTGDDEYTVGYSLDPLYAATAHQSGRTTVDYGLVARGYATVTPLDGSLALHRPSAGAVDFTDALVRKLDRSAP
ncbi:5'/3'-nucleotidase SurE [Nocardioides sp. LS1]|uniref:5'/3'-nucleotidase SurE n=1 Tax=Nocardioides sp. LS1 TaxID=1027620 RepID=UPI000F61E351|nr:5'/3'-nucleotidase SurE [Nocardioides sp. LS1]GCD88128.1 5'-nucleotidase SurE [Nocardioides sp. LS1]